MRYYLSEHLGLSTFTLMITRWVTGPQAAPNQGRVYDVRKSRTAKSYPNRTFSEHFPQLSVSGSMVEDDVTLGNSTAKVNDFALGVVNNQSFRTVNQPFDGFLGLGFPSPLSNREDPCRIVPRALC